MTAEASGWSEDTSRTYLDVADVATPGREEQREVLVSLIPASDQPFTVVDLCCGDGTLCEAVLNRFDAASVIGLDGSETMLSEARRHLAGFGGRAELRIFDLPAFDWLDALPSSVRCVVSSLAIHHLDAEGKQTLFRALRPRIERGGGLLIADVVAPVSDLVRKSHRAAWDRAARNQSLALTGSESLYDRAVADGWGYLDEEDGVDKPSQLFDQLKWLEEAGFGAVDCFWMRGGFAVYGGFR